MHEESVERRQLEKDAAEDLELDERQAGDVRGGDGKAPAPGPLGPDHIVKKHIGGVKYEDL